MIITCWYRITDIDVEFNHISNGWSRHAWSPQPNCEYQKRAWRGLRWEMRRAQLVKGIVIHDKLDGPSEPVRWQ